MSKTKWYAKPIYLLVALALVLSFSLVTAVPAGAQEDVLVDFGPTPRTPSLKGTISQDGSNLYFSVAVYDQDAADDDYLAFWIDPDYLNKDLSEMSSQFDSPWNEYNKLLMLNFFSGTSAKWGDGSGGHCPWMQATTSLPAGVSLTYTDTSEGMEWEGTIPLSVLGMSAGDTFGYMFSGRIKTDKKYVDGYPETVHGYTPGWDLRDYNTASIPPPPSEVWVDDDYCEGCANDGHTWGYDAFNSIQAGIDAVAGSTVHVAAGTYDSSSEAFPIVINKSLTLLGAQADVDPRPSEGGRTGGESIIDADETSSAVIQISAGDVEINGLTITGGMGDMVEESGSADNLLFRYNILYDDLTTAGDEAIQIKNSDSVVMEYNYAYNICQDAFNLSDSTNGAIRYNEAHDIHSENAAIYCYGSTGLEITGNLVYNVPNNDGIKLGDKNGADASKTGGLIKDNIVHGTRQDGISVYMSGVTVEGNEVYNSSSENGAIYLAFAISDITIRNNSVHDNELTPSVKSHVGGIGIESPVDAASVHINNNNIYKNTPYGVNNAASCVVDATSNWWGHASGPHDPDGTNEVPPCTADPATEMNADGTGDKVSDNVDYCPWLTAPYRPTMPMASFVIDHAKIDFKKKADDDKVRVQGKLELGANSNGVEVSEDVTVTEGPLSETITMVEKGKKGEKWEYKRPKGGEGNIKHMTIDWKNGKFDIRMDKADLTELTDPEVTISIQIGDDLGEETIMMRVKKHHWDYTAK